MKVEIVLLDLQKLSGKSKKSGADYNMAIQEAFLHRDGQKYPDRFELTLPREFRSDSGEWKPYPVGVYELDVSASIEVYMGRLSLRPVLVPSKSAVRATAV